MWCGVVRCSAIRCGVGGRGDGEAAAVFLQVLGLHPSRVRPPACLPGVGGARERQDGTDGPGGGGLLRAPLWSLCLAFLGGLGGADSGPKKCSPVAPIRVSAFINCPPGPEGSPPPPPQSHLLTNPLCVSLIQSCIDCCYINRVFK